MNGIIITNQEIGHNQYKTERFIEEFNKLDINIKAITNDGTIASISDGRILVNLPKADFIIYLDKDIYLARLLEKTGFRLFNRADFIKVCDDKVLTFIACADNEIRMPKTFAGPLVYKDIEEKNFEFLNVVEQELGYPMIVKKVYGSLGEGVYLVNDSKELRNLYSKIYRNPILFQEYIKSSKGRSIRIIVINEEPIGGFIRYNKQDFRSNFGKTADSSSLSDNKKYMDFARDIAKKLHIEYAGIDLLVLDNGEPILCEINSNAFFEEFEKVTKINVAQKIAIYIKNKILEETKHE